MVALDFCVNGKKVRTELFDDIETAKTVQEKWVQKIRWAQLHQGETARSILRQADMVSLRFTLTETEIHSLRVEQGKQECLG